MPIQHDRLRALREAKGLTQPQLASQAGMSQSVIAKTEAGRNSPGADVLLKLAQALDCTTDYLLGRGPSYDNPAAAAARMSLDVFAAHQDLTDEQRLRCSRILEHRDAPNTAQRWRSLVEMFELWTAPAPSREQRPKKPVAVSRRALS